jgi:hypothetical protein
MRVLRGEECRQLLLRNQSRNAKTAMLRLNYEQKKRRESVGLLLAAEILVLDLSSCLTQRSDWPRAGSTRREGAEAKFELDVILYKNCKRRLTMQFALGLILLDLRL